MIVIADMALIIVALLATGVAGIVDLKTREVPDWISFGLIFAAGGIGMMYSVLSSKWTYVLYGLAGFVVMYMFGMLMFKMRQWGGGDAKLIMGLGIVFATRPFFLPETGIPFLGVLLLNCLMVGAVYGLVYGVGLAWRKKKAFGIESKKIMKERGILKARWLATGISVIFFCIALALQERILRLSAMLLVLLLVIYPYLWVLIKTVEKVCLYKYLPPAKLTEGDWVDEDIIKNKEVIYRKKNTGIEKEDIQRLIKARIKQVLVKDGIPFTPAFFLGIVVSLMQKGILSFL